MDEPKLADVYRRLAAVERACREFWRKPIRVAGGTAPFSALRSSVSALWQRTLFMVPGRSSAGQWAKVPA